MAKNKHPKGGPPGKQKEADPVEPVDEVEPIIDPVEPISIVYVFHEDEYEYGEWSDTNSFTTL